MGLKILANACVRLACESTNQPPDEIQRNGSDNLGVREQGAESIEEQKHASTGWY